MKKFISLLTGCSLALAGAALAQQPNEQPTPKGKGAGKTHAAQAQPGANAAKPQERPGKQPGAMKGGGATNQPGATNEPGAGKGRKNRAAQESVTGAGTNVSGQPTGGPTTEPGAGKGRKGRAKSETATGAGTNVSGQPAASATPGAKQQAEQRRKGMKGAGAAKTSPTPAAAAVKATPAAGASAAPTVSATGQQRGQANAAAAAKKPAPQQLQQIKQQHANFRAQPKPQQVPAVTYNQNYRIEGSDRWQGPQYDVFRSYHS